MDYYQEDFKIQLLMAYRSNQDLSGVNGIEDIKAIEYALQKTIEQRYPDKCWWEVCKIQIFNRLYFDLVEPEQLVEEILESCRKYDLNDR